MWGPGAGHVAKHTTGGAQWTVTNIHERLDALRADPWAEYAKARQRITREMCERLGVGKSR